MSAHLPAEIRSAVADPKVAATSTLLAVPFYQDEIDPDDYTMAMEEFARRAGDDSYLGEYVTPEYA